VLRIKLPIFQGRLPAREPSMASFWKSLVYFFAIILVSAALSARDAALFCAVLIVLWRHCPRPPWDWRGMKTPCPRTSRYRRSASR
jgi:hypothetical protein